MRSAWRIVLAGCLAELATVVVVVLTITVHTNFAGGSPAENRQFAQTMAARLGPGASILFVFFFAIWAASSVELHPILSGALCGAVAALLTLPALLGAPGPARRLYAVSIALKFVAGVAAGAVAERRGSRAAIRDERGRPPI